MRSDVYMLKLLRPAWTSQRFLPQSCSHVEIAFETFLLHRGKLQRQADLFDFFWLETNSDHFFFKEDESQFRSSVSPEWSDKNHPKTLIPTYTKHMLSFHSFIHSIAKFFCCTCSFSCWQHLQPLTHLLLCKSPRPRNVVISMLVEPTPEQMRNPSKPHGNAPGMWTKHKTCHEWDHCSYSSMYLEALQLSDSSFGNNANGSTSDTSFISFISLT